MPGARIPRGGDRRRVHNLRSGFTIPELAVIMALLVCLLATAAPSLLKSWELSRQNTCREHLKDLSLALVRQQEQSGHFPSGQTAFKLKSNPIGRFADPEEARSSDGKPASGASWVVPILSQLGRKDLADHWEARKSVLTNGAVAQTDIAQLYCPSRRTPLGGAGLIRQCDRIAPDWTAGGNDYAACSGSGITFDDEVRQTWVLDESQIAATARAGISPYSAAPEHRGLFSVNSRVTREEVETADGLAWVILLAERRVFPHGGHGPQSSSDGWAWGGPATLFSTRYAPHTGVHYDESDSAHPGLVHISMADARVRTVSWNIDLRTWNNLGNYAQGSPIEHPDFRR